MIESSIAPRGIHSRMIRVFEDLDTDAGVLSRTDCGQRVRLTVLVY
jgi:hypothetical protein